MSRTTEEVDVEVRNVTVETFETNDGDVLVDRLVFDAPDAPNGRVTYKPRTTEEATHQVGGIKATETNTVRYTLGEFAAEFEGIGDAQDAIEDGERVYLSAQVTKWDQSDEEDTDGDETYAYIDRQNAETLSLEIGE